MSNYEPHVLQQLKFEPPKSEEIKEANKTNVKALDGNKL